MKLFEKKTVESITAPLQKMIADLSEYANEQQIYSDAAIAEAERQKNKAAEHNKEHRYAKDIAGRISILLGGKA